MIATPLQRLLARAALPAVRQPLSVPVPADDAAYLQRKGAARLALRNARRWLQFAASGQAGRLRSAIDPCWRSCLWIHTEAPQVGDALMDLAPRSLLHAHGIAVDLLTAPHLRALFDGDPWLQRCESDAAAFAGSRHDFAIVSSHARRALEPKRRAAPALPWFSLAGFYSVPDYHRALFDTRRLADGLGLRLDDAALRAHSRQKLGPLAPAQPRPPASFSTARVAFALGGVHADRTYRHWPAVLAALHRAGVRRFVLAGSANARAARDALRGGEPPGLDVEDAVDRTDLHGARRLLGASDLVVCADGGLMHLALTTPVPVVALFSGAIDPAWRLPTDFDGAALRSATPEVDGIAPGDVAAAALRCLGQRSGADRSAAWHLPPRPA